MPRCTIITPCFNDGEFLRELRASLASGEAVDHVIVDDGSTDEVTLAVLEELGREPGVTVVRTRNGGPAAARNVAIRQVTTPYTMAIDADDIALPGAIRDMADALDADADLAVVWGDSLAFGAELTYLPRAADMDGWWLTFVNEMGVGIMGRTRELTEAGWDETSGYEDWGTTLALIQQGRRGSNIERPTYGYRQHVATRRLAGAQEKHDAELANLRVQYPSVFAARSAARRNSSAPVAVRLLVRLIAAIPGLSLAGEHRWVNRLTEYIWRRRWLYHPGALPAHPLSRRFGPRHDRIVGRFASHLFSAVPVDSVVILSPHPDDAVLSAFSLLDDPDLAATVINVFTEGETPGDWAQRTASGDSETRRNEDRRAVGDRAEIVDLRCGSDTDDAAIRLRITEALDDLLERSSGRLAVASPAGAGRAEPARKAEQIGPVARVLGAATSARHPEHALVREIVLEWGRTNADATVLLYDELPYHWAASGLDGSGRIVHIPVDTTTKAAAVGCYETQLAALFTEEQLADLSRWLPAVETFAVVGESS